MRTENQDYLRKFVKDKTGLLIAENQSYLFETRLPPLLRKHGVENLDTLVDEVKIGSNPTLVREVTEALMTYESLFFRDSKPFVYLAETVIPELIQEQGKKDIRIWSAACSSGQEPYSIAMVIKENGFDKKANFEIIATDISEGILDKAKTGIYSQFEVQRGLPITHLVKYFSQVDLGWEVKDELKHMIDFRIGNLLEPFPVQRKLDIILCRNVLIYFDKPTKEHIVKKFADVLNPEGVLMLGGSESLIGIDHPFKNNQEKRFAFSPRQAS